MGRVAYHLSEARKFLQAAEEELAGWRRRGEGVLIRDAAEKAWNAVLHATNALLVGKGLLEEEFKSHRARRLALARLELGDRFGAREYYLHERCFYDGEYLPEIVEENLAKARRYVEDVAELLGPKT